MDNYTVKLAIDYLDSLRKQVDKNLDEFWDTVFVPFWKAFDNANNQVNNLNRRIKDYVYEVTIECPAGSYSKIEDGKLDRFSWVPIPCFYGYFNTSIKQEDGDPLDVYIMLPRPFIKELFDRVQVIDVYVLAIIDMEDSNEKDRKAIAIPADLLAYVVNYDMFRQNVLHAVSSILTTILCFKEQPHERSITKVHGLMGYTASQQYLTRLRPKEI